MANFPQLTEEDFQLFNRTLEELLGKTEANTILIVEKAGHLIHQFGDHDAYNTEEIATLASNAFNATQFMAGMMAEPELPGMYQQGEKLSTVILNVGEHCLLVIIFPTQLSVGMIKYYAAKATEDIAQQIKVAEQRAPGVTFDLTALNITDAGAFFRKKQS